MASTFEPLFSAPGGETPDAGPIWLSALQARQGFSADPPFAPAIHRRASAEDEERLAALAQARAEGVAQGRAEALAEIAADASAREGLKLALAQLDETLARTLSQRLAECVAALCEATLAPLALDREALEQRCVAAAAMVGDGITNATLRLHPSDIALLDPLFATTWHILPDAGLERGTVAFDTPEGAVLDGPGEWRDALREVLGLEGVGLC